MSAKLTIAIIGILPEISFAIAERLASTNHVLLFNGNAVKPVFTVDAVPVAVEQINCPVDASWEADLIFLSDELLLEIELLQKIKPVATGKIILLLQQKTGAFKNEIDQLQILLPYSKLVQVYIQFSSIQHKYGTCGLTGDDKIALGVAADIFEKADFITQIIISNTSQKNKLP